MSGPSTVHQLLTSPDVTHPDIASGIAIFRRLVIDEQKGTELKLRHVLAVLTTAARVTSFEPLRIYAVNRALAIMTDAMENSTWDTRADEEMDALVRGLEDGMRMTEDDAASIVSLASTDTAAVSFRSRLSDETLTEHEVRFSHSELTRPSFWATLDGYNLGDVKDLSALVLPLQTIGDDRNDKEEREADRNLMESLRDTGPIEPRPGLWKMVALRLWPALKKDLDKSIKFPAAAVQDPWSEFQILRENGVKREIFRGAIPVKLAAECNAMLLAARDKDSNFTLAVPPYLKNQLRPLISQSRSSRWAEALRSHDTATLHRLFWTLSRDTRQAAAYLLSVLRYLSTESRPVTEVATLFLPHVLGQRTNSRALIGGFEDLILSSPSLLSRTPWTTKDDVSTELALSPVECVKLHAIRHVAGEKTPLPAVWGHVRTWV